MSQDLCLLGLFSNPFMMKRAKTEKYREKDRPGLRLSLRRCCLLTKQAARVLNSTAAARKQIVATTPATTGRASPSSGNSAGGKGSDRADDWAKMKRLQTKTSSIYCSQAPIISMQSLGSFSVRRLTCARHSHYIAALTDQVIHDSHHSKLIPGLLLQRHTKHILNMIISWTVFCGQLTSLLISPLLY